MLMETVPAMKSSKSQAVVKIKDTPGVFMSKKKASAKGKRTKGIDILLNAALTKAAQFKEVLKISKHDSHISHASGLGDGTDLGSGVHDEQQRKKSGIDEGTGIKLRVLDVPIYKLESEEESDESDDGDNDVGDNDDGNDDDKADSERTESDREEIHDLNQSNEEHVEEEEYGDERVHTPLEYELTDEENVYDEEKVDEEKDDEVTKELYKDVNVNLGNEDAEMTNADQGRADQQNNPSPTDNEIASLMDTIVFHEEPSSRTSSLYTVPDKVTNLEKDLSELKQVDQYAQALSSILAIVDRYTYNKLGEAIHKAIQKNVTKSLEVAVLEKSSSQPKSTYEAAASLFEFELTKILMDKIEKYKSYERADYKRELYDALVKSYETDKDLFDTYGEVFTLKTSRDDKDKDQDPFAGLDRGTKRRKSSKEGEPSKDSRSKEKKSSSTSKGVQQNQEFNMGHTYDQPDIKAALKRNCQVAHAEDPPTSFDELYNTPIDFSAFVLNWLNITDLTQEILPLSLIEVQGCQVVPTNYFINNDLEYLKGGSLSKKYTTSTTKTWAAKYDNIEGIEDMVPTLWSPVKIAYDKYALWGISR
ncbi:hypothetical protein Tco_0169818 [Tanacetum coccineum]